MRTSSQMVQMRSPVSVQARQSNGSSSAAKDMGLGNMSYNDAVQQLTPPENGPVQKKAVQREPGAEIDRFKFGNIIGRILSGAALSLKNGGDAADLAASFDAKLSKGLAVFGLTLPSSCKELLDYGRFGETDAMQWIYRTFPQVAHETLGVDDFGKGFANGWAAGGSNVMKGGAPDAYDGTMPAEKVDDKSKSLGIARPNGG